MTILDQFKLDGQVAVVTGGGRGIGEAIALGMAEAGADIVVAARRTEEIEAVADKVRALGRKALAITTDMMEIEQVESRWPWTITSPINVDRDLSQPDQPSDEFAYWSN